jgi:uncharacterized protein YecE (DUF72 family)
MAVFPVYVGTAGWQIPPSFADLFPAAALSHLERYAARFPAVEINSSFYRDHLPKTYARWAATVPEGFRFSVKLSREITHDLALEASAEILRSKLGPITELGKKLGALLVQLPPSLAFSEKKAAKFFRALRKTYGGPAAIEPRHPSWASRPARSVFREFGITQALVDPERCPTDDFQARTGGGFYYFRLHGSPAVYRSAYPPKLLTELAATLDRAKRCLPGWCIFDNTTFGYAARDALSVREALR